MVTGATKYGFTSNIFVTDCKADLPVTLVDSVVVSSLIITLVSNFFL